MTASPVPAADATVDAVPVAWRWRERGRLEWRVAEFLPVKDSDAWEIQPLYASPPTPVPVGGEVVEAVLEALRVEATDNTFPDAWQQGVRYAISEVLDALSPQPPKGQGGQEK